MEMNLFHKSDDPVVVALNVMASAFTSIAHSMAIIAVGTGGITPAQKEVLLKVTTDLKNSHDRLVAATQAATVPAK